MLLEIFIDGEKMKEFSIVEVGELNFEVTLNFQESFSISKSAKIFFKDI